MSDQIVVFGDGDRDAVGVDFLEGVGADHRGGNLTSNANQRDGVQPCIGNGGHQVSRPGPLQAIQTAGLPSVRAIP